MLVELKGEQKFYKILNIKKKEAQEGAYKYWFGSFGLEEIFKKE